MLLPAVLGDVLLAKNETQAVENHRKPHQSDWIQKELRFSVIRCVPVLWIQINNADCNALPIKPSDKPHLCYDSSEFDDNARLSVIADEIMDKLFEIIDKYLK